uniref:RNA-directed RNA polymerase L n=1 Tax=Dipteran phenui-related virus OKIAV274 TaxID=2746251 RepID=A0A7D7EYG8_9VIRU|nr:RNA-dependent RNA polymerase [Dipteran phenui-related virus OKIAV274]
MNRIFYDTEYCGGYLEELYKRAKNEFSNGGFQYTEEPFYRETYAIMPSLEDGVEVFVNDQTNKIDWRWKDDGGVWKSASASAISVRNIRHDFSFSLISRGTDSAISRHFENLDHEDPKYKLTPDLIKRYPEFSLVCEFATFAGSDESSAAQVFKEKTEKYKYSLSSIDEDIVFVVIVVSPTFIISSIDLGELLSVELSKMTILSLALESKLRCDPIVAGQLKATTDEDAIIQKIFHSIRSLRLKDEEGGLIMGETYISRVKNRNAAEDFKKAHASYYNCFKRMGKDVMTKRKEPTVNDYIFGTIPNSVSDYINLVRSQDFSRKHRYVCQFPLVCSAQTDYDVTVPCLIFKKDSYMHSVWDKAISCRSNRDVNNFYYSQVDPDLIRGLDDIIPNEKSQVEKSYNKRTRNRVTIKKSLNQNELLLLAKDGVWGKKWRYDQEVLEKSRENKMPLSIDINVDYIRNFLVRDDLLQYFPLGRKNSNVIDLLEVANEKVKAMEGEPANIQMEEIVSSIMSTKLYNAMDLIADIGIELGVSLKQNCSGGRMILKKIPHWPVLMLVRPTTSDGHVHFSLLFYNVKGQNSHEVLDDSGVFRSLAYGSVMVTDFISIRADRLENIVSAPDMLIAMFSYWSWHCSFNLHTNFCDLSKIPPDMLSHLLSSMLIRLEDRAETEETITLTRYMYFEMFKTSPLHMIKGDPFKMIAKFNTCPRSTLNVFFIQQIIRCFQLMDVSPPIVRPVGKSGNIFDEDGEQMPEDEWDNVVSFVDGTPVTNSSRLVGLFYLGYAHSKGHKAQGNTDFHLVNKVLSEELKYNPDESHKSNGTYDSWVLDGEHPMDKQFSLYCIRNGVDGLLKRINQTHPHCDPRSVLSGKVLKMLANQYTHELATLKASSTVEHTPISGQISAEDERADPKRMKVMVNLMEHLELVSINPILSITRVLDHIESTSGGIIADLFKKAQHGGLREIYVLTIYSRIVQLTIETISRGICGEFEEEVLTHPEKKLRIIEDHIQQSAKHGIREGKSYHTICNSSDKARWNQNLVMPALAAPLILMLPDEFTNLIVRSLNLWTKKWIKLPHAVSSLMLMNTRLNSPVYRELKKQFDDSFFENTDLFKKKHSTLIQTKTGMMQGILHYTSSLLHLACLSSSKQCIYATLSSIANNDNLMISAECSSDDSAILLTVFHEMDSTLQQKRNNLDMCELALNAMKYYCNYFCMIESAKSVLGLNNNIEFNSEFFFRNTLTSPILKFVYTTMSITESEGFVDRQHQLYGLLSSVSSAGLPAFNTKLIQMAQGVLHYRTLGSSASLEFKTYSNSLKDYPDPSLGFFILDSSLIPGVMGWSFTSWFNARNTKIMNITSKNHITQLSDGSVLKDLKVHHGDLKKWHRLVSKVSGTHVDLAREEVNKKYDIMYRVPKDNAEVKLKITAKSLLPGVKKSLGSSNPFLSAISMSVYCIREPCFTKVKKSVIDGKLVMEKEKVSLSQELSLCIKEANELENLDLSNQEILSYPNHSRYKLVYSVLSAFSDSNLMSVNRRRQKKNIIVIPGPPNSSAQSLLEICNSVWFGSALKSDHSIKKRTWNDFKLLYPWLHENPNMTLDQSPFDDHIGLYNFLSSGEKHRRTFVKVGPKITGSDIAGNVRSHAIKCFIEGYNLFSGNLMKDKSDFSENAIRNLRSDLALTLSIPIKNVKIYETDKVLRSFGETAKLSDCKDMGFRDYAAVSFANYAIASHNKNENRKKEIVVGAQISGHGYQLIYIQPQRTRNTPSGAIQYYGYGRLLLSNDNHQLIVRLEDETYVEFHTDNLETLRKDLYKIHKILKSQKLTPSNEYRPTGLTVVGNNIVCGRPAYGVMLKLSERSTVLRKDPDMSGMRIEGNTLVLTATYNRKVVPIIEFVPFKKDLLINTSKEVKENIWKAWVSQCPTSTKSVLTEIKKSITINWRDGYSDQTRQELRSFLKEALIARLIFYGYWSIGSRMPPIEETVKPRPDISDEEYERLLAEISDQMDRAIPLFITRLSMFEDPQGNVDVLHSESMAIESAAYNLFQETPLESWEILSIRKFDLVRMHPLMDNLIKEVENDEPGLWKLIQRGYSNNEENKVMIMDICSLLDINYIGVKKSIGQSYNPRDFPESSPPNELPEGWLD